VSAMVALQAACVPGLDPQTSQLSDSINDQTRNSQTHLQPASTTRAAHSANSTGITCNPHVWTHLANGTAAQRVVVCQDCVGGELGTWNHH
jgi:hypothetical protein